MHEVHNKNDGPLQGLNVLDLTDERAIFGSKLLADLGANTIRPQAASGDPLRQRGPFYNDISLWYAFFATNRKTPVLSASPETAKQQRAALMQAADIVLYTAGHCDMDAAELQTASSANPQLIAINVSSMGSDGPWKDYLAPDLIAGALGGAVATTGDENTTPLKIFGDLNFMVSGIYAAIAALSALHARHRDGVGQQVDLSVHECIASCLEQVLMMYWYAERMGRADEKIMPRRGAMHWSNAYCVYPAKTGSIMVTPAPDWDSQLAWLIEEGVHEDLLDEKYSEPENLPLRIKRSMEIMKEWVKGKDAAELFTEAQERHSPYGHVLPIETLADNPQLKARDWYVSHKFESHSVQQPGAPYQFSRTPWKLKDSEASRLMPESDWQSTLDELGWAKKSTEAADKSANKRARPLEGLKVLDFTHVLAGPFATRVLADMGADVVKVNSASRALAANDPSSPYYIMWNRSKRALSLNMANPEARKMCRSLCEQADVVIDNFSVGVLDRWGVGYQEVSQLHPGVIYVQMSGMGEGGPWSNFVTYAPTIHALCGLTHLTGVPGREDLGIGFSYNDHQAGLHGAIAILAALQHRTRTGEGQRVDISQFEVGVTFAGPALMDSLMNERHARPCGNDLPYDQVAPHGVYQGAPNDVQTVVDQRWLAIACYNDDQWSALQDVMGHPDWSSDSRFTTSDGRYEARRELDAHLASWVAGQDVYELMQTCQQAGVPAGVVQDGGDLNERDPQLAAAGFFKEIPDVHEAIGQTWADALPLHFQQTPCNEYQRVRVVGEDNHAVLADWLGLSAQEVDAAQQDGRLQ